MCPEVAARGQVACSTEPNGPGGMPTIALMSARKVSSCSDAPRADDDSEIAVVQVTIANGNFSSACRAFLLFSLRDRRLGWRGIGITAKGFNLGVFDFGVSVLASAHGTNDYPFGHRWRPFRRRQYLTAVAGKLLGTGLGQRGRSSRYPRRTEQRLPRPVGRNYAVLRLAAFIPSLMRRRASPGPRTSRTRNCLALSS
jgi:hypothetical protein